MRVLTRLVEPEIDQSALAELLIFGWAAGTKSNLKGIEALLEATPDNAVSGKYPLSRFLYVYVNKHPNKELAPLDKEFIKLILSKQGQEVVIKDGYIPLPEKVVTKYLKQI